MATTTNTYTATAGQTDFAITFEYIEQNDVFVTVNESANTAWTFLNATTIRFNAGLAAGDVVLIYRRTDEDLLEARFLPGSAIRAKDLNANDEQLLFLIQENQSSIKAIQGGSDSGELPPPDPGDSVSLNDLSDVTITNPANGNILEFDGTNWENTPWHQADWAQEDTTQPGFIQNKPDAFGTTYLGTRNCVDNGPTDDEPVGGFYVNTAGGTPDAGWDFPQGTQLGINDRVIKLEDETWSIFGVGNNVVAQDTPPESALGGDLWWDSGTTTALYFFYVDDDGGQWVPCTPSGGVVGSDEIANGSVTPEKLSTGGPSWTIDGDFSSTRSITAHQNGFFSIGGDAEDGDQGVTIENGIINVCSDGGGNGVVVRTEGSGDIGVSLDGDGEAFFNNTVTVNGEVLTGSVDISGDNDGIALSNDGQITLQRKNANASSFILRGFAGTTENVNIKADGSASFTGSSVNIGNYTFDSSTTSGAEFDSGALTLQRLGSVGATSRSIAGRWGADIKWEIDVDGSASFEKVSAPNACTAWVNFAGANGALRDSFNVSGPVTRLAAGRYRVTFSTAMDNSNYAVMVSSNQLTTIIDSISAASFEMSVFDGSGSRVDTTIICATVYGGKD